MSLRTTAHGGSAGRTGSLGFVPRASIASAVAGAVTLGLLAACGSGGDADAVPTLAKTDGWRSGLDTTSFPSQAGFAVLELAYDEAGALALWDAAVPDGLPAASGDPVDVGIYGDLADVDLTTHVVGLWSSGQSGSCPGWLDAARIEDGELWLVDADGGPGECTTDYNAYSQVVVLERDRVPPAGSLPVTARLTHAAMADVPGQPGTSLRALVTAFVG